MHSNQSIQSLPLLSLSEKPRNENSMPAIIPGTATRPATLPPAHVHQCAETTGRAVLRVGDRASCLKSDAVSRAANLPIRYWYDIYLVVTFHRTCIVTRQQQKSPRWSLLHCHGPLRHVCVHELAPSVGSAAEIIQIASSRRQRS